MGVNSWHVHHILCMGTTYKINVWASAEVHVTHCRKNQQAQQPNFV